MDKLRNGNLMETYSLGNIRMAHLVKVKCMSWNKIAHFMLLEIIKVIKCYTQRKRND